MARRGRPLPAARSLPQGSPTPAARPPLSGLDEHRGHAGRGVQDLVDLHLRPAVHAVPLPRVTRRQLVQHRELIVPAALGAQPDLVAMVLDLRFVPQCRLDLGSETSRLFSCFQGSAHKVVRRHLVSLPGPLSDPIPRPHTCPRLPRGTKGVTGADTPTPGAESLPPSPNCVPTLHVVHVRGEAPVLAQSYLTLQPHGLQLARLLCPWDFFQARIPEWVAISSSRGFFWPGDRTHASCISCTDRRILYHCATWEGQKYSNPGNRPLATLKILRGSDS